MWKVEKVTLAEKTRWAVRKYYHGKVIDGAGHYDYLNEAERIANNLNIEEGYYEPLELEVLLHSPRWRVRRTDMGRVRGEGHKQLLVE